MEHLYVDIHTHSLEQENGVVKLYSHALGYAGSPEIPDMPFCAGVHPWHVNDMDESVLDFFDIPHKNLMAIGEIGLDFSAVNLNKSKQYEWFSKQLAIAEKLQLPVVVHCVKAYSEVVAELKNHKLKGIVIHGIIASYETANKLINSNIKLSIGTNSLRSYKTVEAIKKIGKENIFIETDNTGTYIIDMYRQVADITGLDIKILKELIFNSYRELFKP